MNTGGNTSRGVSLDDLDLPPWAGHGLIHPVHTALPAAVVVSQTSGSRGLWVKEGHLQAVHSLCDHLRGT